MKGLLLASALALSGCVYVPAGTPPSHRDVALAERSAAIATVFCPLTTVATLAGDVFGFIGGQIAWFLIPQASAEGIGYVTGSACLGKQPAPIVIKWPWEK
ncbi:MAG: hypothetical protein KGL39_44960 [Patescibacteria group bacterium]|nr:hypothetical protein [Patescibacteria group bacterium]